MIPRQDPKNPPWRSATAPFEVSGVRFLVSLTSLTLSRDDAVLKAGADAAADCAITSLGHQVRVIWQSPALSSPPHAAAKQAAPTNTEEHQRNIPRLRRRKLRKLLQSPHSRKCLQTASSASPFSMVKKQP
jgi:hypothetical protein